nr:immunoglobulin light chain junction region [Macaca mulatta]
ACTSLEFPPFTF